MTEENELEINEVGAEGKSPFFKRRKIQPEKSKFLPILIGVVLVALFAVGIIYFVAKHSAGKDETAEPKGVPLDQRVAEVEKTVADLQARVGGTATTDPALLQRIDQLSQKVDVLEQRRTAEAEPKARPAVSKPSHKPEVRPKQYHTVRKGDTIQKISNRYGLSVADLRKLNKISAGQTIHAGQKLRLS